ncbi:hypothetical protein [uncultured Agathobaculum sp.]|uniref:hypothetical protein n=1 Tax=uncultured Agathobaculum sp. TaxID=2048140 RepID=UPI00296E7847
MQEKAEPSGSAFRCRETAVSPARGTDRRLFQSHPKVLIRELFFFENEKTEAHVLGFLAFAGECCFMHTAARTDWDYKNRIL